MKALHNTMRQWALALALPMAAGVAHAQTTIDQATALAGNVTPGDTPGFPVKITVPGSYKLTSNLEVPLHIQAILVVSPGVTIDLNGFAYTERPRKADAYRIQHQADLIVRVMEVTRLPPGMNGRDSPHSLVDPKSQQAP